MYSNTTMDSLINGIDDWIKEEPRDCSVPSSNGELDLDQSGANVKREVQLQIKKEPAVEHLSLHHNKSISDDWEKKVFCDNEPANDFDISAQHTGHGSPNNSGQDLKQELKQMLQCFSSETHPCLQCEQEFSTSWLLESHMHHCLVDTLCKNRTEPTVERPKEEWAYKCDECGKKSKLKDHLESHTGERPFRCDIDKCGKEFSEMCDFKFHRLTHANTCEECGENFINSSLLSVHDMRTHTRERPHKCAECGKGFINRYTLKQHMEIHIGERPFKCGECGKDFIRKGYLLQHMKRHTGEKPHKCDECGKGFSARSTLNRHLVLHTGEKPHKCAECDKGFSTGFLLKKHMKIHTGDHIYVRGHTNVMKMVKTSLE